MQKSEKPSALSKCTLNLNDANTETATTKFVIVVTVLGIIFFIVLYLIIILKSDSHVTENTATTSEDTENDVRKSMIVEGKKNANNSESEMTEDLAKAETLVSPVGKFPPRPFVNNFRGPSPASFHPTRPRPTGVTYAQLQNYNIGSHLQTPHNIQDIIGFLMPNEQPKKKNALKPFLNTNSHDPFYPYKPKDPSDINLLATANLRFAPPIWKEIRANPAPSPSSIQPHETSVFEQQATRNSKALTLTLNVFPMGNDPRKEHFYAVSSNMMPNGVSRKIQQPRKMIIHLNLYQNNEILNRGEIADEDYEMERNLIERSMHGLQQVLNKNMKN